MRLPHSERTLSATDRREYAGKSVASSAKTISSRPSTEDFCSTERRMLSTKASSLAACRSEVVPQNVEVRRWSPA